MRLIDADEVLARIENPYQRAEIARWLRDAPTIERKTGHWIDAEWVRINTGEKRKGRRCSECGSGFFRYDVSVNTVSDIPNYCPNCGSYMRGDDHEND